VVLLVIINLFGALCFSFFAFCDVRPGSLGCWNSFKKVMFVASIFMSKLVTPVGTFYITFFQLPQPINADPLYPFFVFMIVLTCYPALEIVTEFNFFRVLPMKNPYKRAFNKQRWMNLFSSNDDHSSAHNEGNLRKRIVLTSKQEHQLIDNFELPLKRKAPRRLTLDGSINSMLFAATVNIDAERQLPASLTDKDSQGRTQQELKLIYYSFFGYFAWFA
jgi:hypothetical protein